MAIKIQNNGGKLKKKIEAKMSSDFLFVFVQKAIAQNFGRRNPVA